MVEAMIEGEESCLMTDGGCQVCRIVEGEEHKGRVVGCVAVRRLSSMAM